MKTIRLLISGPDDVAAELRKAREVIASLQPRYAGRFRLIAVEWDDLAIQPDAPFRSAVEQTLSATNGIDLAVFAVWSQLGSAPLAPWKKDDGTAFETTTERDFGLMLAARDASGGGRPAILAYRRNDPDGFLERQKGQPLDQLEDMLRQRRLAENFLNGPLAAAAKDSRVRAVHTFTQPVEFAHRLRVHVREILDSLLGEGGAATWDVSEMGAPFRGLDAFEPQHAGIFFGREEEICGVQLALRRQAAAGTAFVLIVGASGSGKSSLARAGVLPAVTQFDLDDTVRSWRQAIFIPGTSAKDLCAGLARMLCAALPELREADTSIEALAAGLRDNPKLTCRLILPNALGPGVRLFLLLDQFEEIFSHAAISPADRDAFITSIDALARSGAVWVLATVRSDFYEQCQTLPRLMELKGAHGQFDLLPPNAEALRRIITAPASLAGLRYERNESTGEALDRRLLDDALRHPEALPLLEYALRELFEHREPDGTLTLARYRELGGVEGALGHRAEAVFLALPVGVQAALDGVFSALVTVREDVDAGATRARVPTETVAFTPERATLIEAFVRERLFFTDRDASSGEAILTLSHEALLRCWPRAAQWIEHNRDFLRVRARLRESIRAWSENERATDYLLPPGKPVEDARTLLAARGDDLSQGERDYIEASVDHSESRGRASKRRRRLAFAAMAFLTTVAVAGGGFALQQTKVAFDQRKAAEAAATNERRERERAEEATMRVTAQAAILEQQKAEATAARKNAETERQRAEEATAQARAQAEALKQREAEANAARKNAEDSRKIAEENRSQAEAILDYLRGDLRKQLTEKGRLTVLQAVEKRVADYYDKLGMDENDPAQMARRAEDAIKAGDTGMEMGDLKSAEASYRKALKIATALAERDPNSNDRRLQLSVSLVKLGDTQIAQEDFKAAAASYGEALKIRRQLSQQDPSNRDWQLSLSVSHDKMGDLETRQSNLNSAAASYREALNILKALAARDPGERVVLRSMSVCYSKTGDNQRSRGDLDGAAASHGQAMRILQQLVDADPENPGLQRELSASHGKLGAIAQGQRNLPAAAKNYGQAADILRKLTTADPENSDWQLSLSVNLANLASVRRDQGDLQDAEEKFTRAIAILDRLAGADKLPRHASEWPAVFRENLEAVKEARKPGRK